MGWGEELLDQAAVHQCRTGLLRVASQDVTIHMSALAPPPEPIGIGVTGGPEPVRYGWGRTRQLTMTTEITQFQWTAT